MRQSRTDGRESSAEDRVWLALRSIERPEVAGLAQRSGSHLMADSSAITGPGSVEAEVEEEEDAAAAMAAELAAQEALLADDGGNREGSPPGVDGLRDDQVREQTDRKNEQVK